MLIVLWQENVISQMRKNNQRGRPKELPLLLERRKYNGKNSFENKRYGLLNVREPYQQCDKKRIRRKKGKGFSQNGNS